jgi:hypothetical protein
MQVRDEAKTSPSSTNDKIDFSFIDKLQDNAAQDEETFFKAQQQEGIAKATATPELMDKIAAYLEARIQRDKLAKENILNFKGIDKINGHWACGSLPSVSIKSYLYHIRQCSPSNMWECYIAMLIYIDRYLALNNHTADFLNPYNVHRLVLTALLIAIKYGDDTFSNSHDYDAFLMKKMAKCGRVRVKELITLETELLSKINFSLYYTPETYRQYEDKLSKPGDSKNDVKENITFFSFTKKKPAPAIVTAAIKLDSKLTPTKG